jgi:hypothetical protein
MENDKPHLTLVDSDFVSEHDQEFAPLPYFPWDERPSTLPLDQDECATALHLSQGHLPRAASLLKVPLIRLNRMLKHSPRLQRVFSESAELIVARAFSKYIDALDAEDARRQEWGATKIMQSRAAMGHLFSPAPPANTASNIAVNAEARTVTFRWADGQSLSTPEIDPSTLVEHDPDE